MNLDAPIFAAASGRPLFKVGDISHKQFRRGDYHVSIEWLTEGRKTEPCMFIWSPTSADGGTFGIPLSVIGKYATEKGDPTPEAFLECWHALPTLGRAQLQNEVYRLLDVILRHTPDLIRCPPMPPAARAAEKGDALVEMTLVANGKTVREDLI